MESTTGEAPGGTPRLRVHVLLVAVPALGATASPVDQLARLVQ